MRIGLAFAPLRQPITPERPEFRIIRSGHDIVEGKFVAFVFLQQVLALLLQLIAPLRRPVLQSLLRRAFVQGFLLSSRCSSTANSGPNDKTRSKVIHDSL